MRTQPAIRLRDACPGDCKLLYTWANDSVTRRNSIQTDPISWEVHCVWFARKLANPNHLLLIAEDKRGTPVGQIRFDLTDREAIVSISIAQEFRGNGFACPIIVAGLERLWRHGSVQTVHAWIRPENMPSRTAFQRAGFLPLPRTPDQIAPEVNGSPTILSPGVAYSDLLHLSIKSPCYPCSGNTPS